MKGRIGRSGFGIGAALRGVLVFGFGQDIYDLELWWRMWPYNEPPLKEQYKRECARLRFLFLLLLLFSLSLLLFRREVVCWAATDCPDVQGEILVEMLAKCRRCGDVWGYMLAKCRRCGDVWRRCLRNAGAVGMFGGEMLAKCRRCGDVWRRYACEMQALWGCLGIHACKMQALWGCLGKICLRNAGMFGVDIVFPFRDAWVQIAGQVRRDLVGVICQF